MNISLSERPGIYSGYSASSIVTASASNGEVAFVTVNKAISAPKRYVTAAAARADFGTDDMAYKCVEAALAGGASACWVAPVTGSIASTGLLTTTAQDYGKTVKKMREEGAYVYFTDATDRAAWQSMRDEALAASATRNECICVFAAVESPDTLCEWAELLSSERCVIAGPVPYGSDGLKIPPSIVAASIAAAIVSLPDPAVPLGGATLPGIYAVGSTLDDSVVDQLVTGGVTPIECIANKLEVVRGVTTRVTTDDVADTTWRELSTILVADDVMRTLRSTLKSRFARAKNIPSTREAVASQTTVVLEAKKTAGIIADYGAVKASSSESDPSRCDVSFEFAVAHGMDRIVISANILV